MACSRGWGRWGRLGLLGAMIPLCALAQGKSPPAGAGANGANRAQTPMSRAALEQKVKQLQGQVDQLEAERMRARAAPRRAAHPVVETARAHLQVWGQVMTVGNDRYFVRDQKGNLFALWVDEDTAVKKRNRPVPVSEVHPGDTIIVQAVGEPGGLVARHVWILTQEEVEKRHRAEENESLRKEHAPRIQKTPAFGTHAN